MAFTLEQLRSEGLTSIYGRRLSIDKDDFLVGPKGLRDAITEDITHAATGTTIVNYGMTRITSSANGGSTQAGLAYTLQAPVVGARKTIFHYGASTSCHVFGMSGSAIVQGGSLTSLGSTMISFFRQNAFVELLGISMAIWLALGLKSSAGASSDMWGISFSATLSS